MKMPKLTPLPIGTKNKTFFAQIWIWITGIRTWMLVEDWQYQVTEETRVVIPKGFIFDGASIPRPLWGILSPTGLLLIPGLIHDFGYRYDYIWAFDSEGYVYKKHQHAGQKFWDKLFFDVGEKVNEMRAINSLAWVALFFMGCIAWNANRKRNEGDILPNKPMRPQSPKKGQVSP